MKKQPDWKMILRLRRTQPEAFEALAPETRLQALEFEARQRSLAELGYARDERMEGLLILQRDKPKVFASLSLGERIAVGRYAQIKSDCEARNKAA